MPARAETDKPLYLPNLGEYTPLLARYLSKMAWTRIFCPRRRTGLRLGRAQTSAKEYLPFAALLGGVLASGRQTSRPHSS